MVESDRNQSEVRVYTCILSEIRSGNNMGEEAVSLVTGCPGAFKQGGPYDKVPTEFVIASTGN